MMRRIAAIALAACLGFAASAASATEKKYPPGASFKDCAGCPEMVVIPPGSFTMGSPVDEQQRNDDETPQHLVDIKYKFAVGKFEVTQAEWRHIMGGNPSHFKGDRNPVEQILWADIRVFMRKLSQRTGKRYGLLSAAEWEYVARAGTTTPFHTGATITAAQANFNGQYTYNGAAEGQNRGRTVSVGQFPANRFGVYDMHGNVWELVEDCWNGSYSGAPNDGSSWTTGYCDKYVFRGGSWNNVPKELRSANRYWDKSNVRNSGFGFRVARTLSR